MSAAPSIDSHLADHRSRTAGEGVDDRGVAPVVRAYLEDVRGHLEALHRSTLSGRAVNEANSDLIDRLVRRLFALAEERVVAGGGQVERGLCVVAVGGYSRREMSIHSDVDLLLVYSGALTPYVASVAERVQYWLWDAGLTVGCATRTTKETLRLAREDATVRTAVLTARYLCGDGEFFHEFADAIRKGLLSDPRRFIAELVALQKERHERFGESLFLLQPNLKEGAGALRDYHSAFWVARVAQPATRHLDDLLHVGLLTEPEMDEYRDALEFLWRARNELHLKARRCSDQMSFELQEYVASALGYDVPMEEGADLPVERFMRDYYRHARAIQNYSELVIEQCTARVAPASERRRDVVTVEDGFQHALGHLEIPHVTHLREQPIRLLTVFEVAQVHDLPLSRMARRLVRENLGLVDEDFRRSSECAEAFLRILAAPRRVMRTLMAMNEVGLLAAVLPEWEHIVCRWQHVIYHTYTVDVHSIFLVEELRRLWRGKYEAALPQLTELVRGVADMAVLFLGCLLHDIGKGFGGDHSNRGATRAEITVERLGLSPERAERVIFLVKHHLLMSHLAQRRDLSDAKMILEFAKICGDRVNLHNLYLITFADIRAASRDAWTEWKGQLLHELFERTAEFLETRPDDEMKAMELIEARVEVRREGARAELQALGVGALRIESYFDDMPRRYFITHTPRQIARHAQVALRFTAERVMSIAHREMRGGFSEFILCTGDVHGLYAQVAGTLTACGINILGSHVYTTRGGLALEVYRLSTPSGGEEEIQTEWERLERTLARVLAGEVDVRDLLKQRRRPIGATRSPARKAPRVVVSNTESDFYTIVDVNADDRIGLLYDLTNTIGALGLEIYISKAATIQDQVADTFYLKDASGKKIREAHVVERLRSELTAAVSRGEDGVRA